MTYFSQKEFQAFVAAIMGHVKVDWVALSGKPLSESQARALEQLIDEFSKKQVTAASSNTGPSDAPTSRGP